MANTNLPDALRREVLDALEKCGGNQSAAARMLGLNLNTYKSRLNTARSSPPATITNEHAALARIKDLEAEVAKLRARPPEKATPSYNIPKDKHTASKRSDTAHARRHFIIPDTQVRPGVPLDHIGWIAQAIVDYRPDVLVHLGDHWDFPSLNSHNVPGSAPLEGRRYQDDLDVGNAAFARLCAPMEREAAKKGNTWKPVKKFLEGNHENRADRAASNDPKWMGHVGSNNCQVRDWDWHQYLERVKIDGVLYSHYFQNSHSSYPIGGTADNRLNKIGCSFVQGHEQGFRYGTRITGSGATWHGIVAGSCYLHIEDYRGRQGQRHWRGVVILNEVENGDFCVMPLTLNYLCRKYEGVGLYDFISKKYPDGDWEHVL